MSTLNVLVKAKYDDGRVIIFKSVHAAARALNSIPPSLRRVFAREDNYYKTRKVTICRLGVSKYYIFKKPLEEYPKYIDPETGKVDGYILKEANA